MGKDRLGLDWEDAQKSLSGNTRPPSSIMLRLTKIFIYSIFILCGLVLIYGVFYLIKLLIFPVFLNFLDVSTLQMYLIIIILGVMIAGAVILLIYAVRGYRKLKHKPWLYWMIFFMIAFFIIGVLIIDYNMGYRKNLDLVLRDANANLNIVGNINCTTEKGMPIYVHDIGVCNVVGINISNITGQIKFSFNDGTFETESLSNNITFVAKENIEYISFQLYGVDSNNKSRSLTTGDKYSFLTNDLVKEQKIAFFNYILILLSVIFVTVPTALSAIRSLAEK